MEEPEKYHRRNKNTDLGLRKKGEANIAETVPETDVKLQKREGGSDEAICLKPKLTMPLSPEQKANFNHTSVKAALRAVAVLPHLSSGRSAGLQPARGLPCYEFSLANHV